MSKVIEKNGKFYIQEIIETEVSLDEFQKKLEELKLAKKNQFDELDAEYGKRIKEIQNQINQINEIKKSKKD